MITRLCPRVVFLSVAMLFCATNLSAQKSAVVAQHKRVAPDKSLRVSLIAGPGVATPTPYLFTGPDGGIYRTMKRPTVFETEISRSLRRSTGERVVTDYYIAAQPVVSIGGNVRYAVRACRVAPCGSFGERLAETHYTSYGFGITPIGLRETVHLPFGTQLDATFGAGAVYLSRAVPYDKATHFNFHFNARPEIGFPAGRFGIVWTGYEFFHFSNGGTGKLNPGLNGGLFVVGFQRGAARR